MPGLTVPSIKPSPAAGSAAAHLDSALEMICAALVALDTICSVPANALDARGARRPTTQAVEHLRQAYEELRAVREEGPKTLVAGFVLQAGIER